MKSLLSQPIARALVYAALLLIAAPLHALEYRVQFGAEDNWKQFSRRENVLLERGSRGYYDVRLENQRYQEDSATDLSLSFDQPLTETRFGGYTLHTNRALITTQHTRIGGGAAYFSHQGGGLVLYAHQDSLFGEHEPRGDFSIAFYAHAATLSDYERLLYWKFENEYATSAGQPNLRPRIELLVMGEHMQWNFVDFFRSAGVALPLVTLRAADAATDREWQHHLVRYTRARGRLEYYIDGVLQAITHTGPSGRERGAPFIDWPVISSASPATLEIAPAFSGVIDEFYIARTLVQPRPPRLYSYKSGVIESDIIDLAERRGRLVRFTVHSRTPENSAIRLEYRASLNRSNLYDKSIPWREARSDVEILPVVPTRFLQIRAHLLPDGVGAASPRLSFIDVTIAPPAPILAPRNPAIRNVGGQSELVWEPPPDLREISYRLYYGTRPGRYPFSVDVATNTSYRVNALQPNTPYYFVIESYHSDYPTLPGGRSEPLYIRTP